MDINLPYCALMGFIMLHTLVRSDVPYFNLSINITGSEDIIRTKEFYRSYLTLMIMVHLASLGLSLPEANSGIIWSWDNELVTWTEISTGNPICMA